MTEPELEALAFINARRAYVERWSKPVDPVKGPQAADGDYWGVGYWMGSGLQRRIHQVGRTLAEAVEKCRAKE